MNCERMMHTNSLIIPCFALAKCEDGYGQQICQMENITIAQQQQNKKISENVQSSARKQQRMLEINGIQ